MNGSVGGGSEEGYPVHEGDGSDALFQARGLSMKFGGLDALSGFNLNLQPGELVGLIGPNGAGKTTVFNVITGVHKPTSGRILFRGRDITGLAAHRVTQSGVARTFQNIRLFGDLSVRDNVLAAFHYRVRYSDLGAVLRSRAFRAEERRMFNDAEELLALFDLDGKVSESAHSLSYGEQRKLEIVRALATKPKLLLLDEPVAGMNAAESQALLALVRRIRDEHSLTILLVEHDMHFVMNICERLVVLDYGRVIARGAPRDIQKNAEVVRAYLGE